MRRKTLKNFNTMSMCCNKHKDNRNAGRAGVSGGLHRGCERGHGLGKTKGVPGAVMLGAHRVAQETMGLACFRTRA